MVPMSTSIKKPIPPSLESDFTTITTEYTPTGFGQLPVPNIRTKSSRSKYSNLQIILLTVALILCLIGVIYLLLFVTITF